MLSLVTLSRRAIMTEIQDDIKHHVYSGGLFMYYGYPYDGAAYLSSYNSDSQDSFARLLLNLRQDFEQGVVTEVLPGNSIIVGRYLGLHSMIVKDDRHRCIPWSLLVRQDVDKQDMSYTPFLFKSKTFRDMCSPSCSY